MPPIIKLAARFPHPTPPEGEGANESLREFHVKPGRKS